MRDKTDDGGPALPTKGDAEDWERWATEVLTDFRIPFDDHTVGKRVAITQWMADAMLAARKEKP